MSKMAEYYITSLVPRVLTMHMINLWSNDCLRHSNDNVAAVHSKSTIFVQDEVYLAKRTKNLNENDFSRRQKF